MDTVLGAVESLGIAEYLRHARWSYAAVNAAHIFGIALLVGAILPLDLRFLGFWRHIPTKTLAQVLVPVAATGLGIAIVAGLLLFSVRAREYAGNDFLRLKLVLAGTGVIAALAIHRVHGPWLATASDSRLAWHGILSMTCWIGALISGRLIAFAAD